MSSAVHLVIPLFNEAGRLDLRAFEEALRGRAELKFLLVDDGSTDATPARIAELAAAWPERVGTIRLPINSGKAEAVRRGMLAAWEAGSPIVGYWDADLATPFRELDALLVPLTEKDEVQVVLGARVQLLGREIVRSPFRHYAGRVFATVASLLLDVPVYDTQCGAKLFRRTEELRRALGQPFLSRWIFDVELLSRLDRVLPRGLAGHAVEVPLRAWRDVRGSRLGAEALLRAPVELVRIAILHRRRIGT